MIHQNKNSKYELFQRFGEAVMQFFRDTWCTFDYSAAEMITDGGKYERIHTLSDGDNVCDMRWFFEHN
jgi:hypothetical protein